MSNDAASMQMQRCCIDANAMMLHHCKMFDFFVEKFQNFENVDKFEHFEKVEKNENLEKVENFAMMLHHC